MSGKRNYGRPRHPNRDEALELVAKGYTIKEVTEKFELGDSTICSWLGQAKGTHKRRRQPARRGVPPHEKKPDPILVAKAVEMRAQGARVVEIAKAVNRSTSRVWFWLRRLNSKAPEP